MNSASSGRASCGAFANKPEQWVQQTDFSNCEAVGYLADRLNRIGLKIRLLELGALPGDGVAIGGADAVIFDFAPDRDWCGDPQPPRRGPAAD